MWWCTKELCIREQLQIWAALRIMIMTFRFGVPQSTYRHSGERLTITGTCTDLVSSCPGCCMLFYYCLLQVTLPVGMTGNELLVIISDSVTGTYLSFNIEISNCQTESFRSFQGSSANSHPRQQKTKIISASLDLRAGCANCMAIQNRQILLSDSFWKWSTEDFVLEDDSLR